MRHMVGWTEGGICKANTSRSADPLVGNHVLQRRKEFQQAAVTAKIIGTWAQSANAANIV
jgi:hypothetical protein